MWMTRAVCLLCWRHDLFEKPLDLLSIVGIGEAIAMSVACCELQAAVGNELGHLTLHAGVNHTILLPTEDQCRATRMGKDAPMVQIQQRCHQSLEAFRIARFPHAVEQWASERGEPEVLDGGIEGLQPDIGCEGGVLQAPAQGGPPSVPRLANPMLSEGPCVLVDIVGAGGQDQTADEVGGFDRHPLIDGPPG